MSWKRLALCALLVMMTKAVVGAIAFGLVFADVVDRSSPALRAEGTEHHGLALLGYGAWSAAFSVLFARGGGGRVMSKGLRFGLLVFLLYYLPMTLGIHAYFAVSGAWTAAALVTGLAEALACGAVASLALRRHGGLVAQSA